MRGLDGDSTQYECPDFVTFAFQVRYRAVEFHIGEASNIFSNNISGDALLDDPKHFRPEVAVIILASALPGLTEWLAQSREPAANNVNCSGGFLNDSFGFEFFISQFPYIRIHRHIRPVLVEYLGAERIHLAKRNRLECFGCPVQS
jgi:hypothetical protein